MDIKILGANCTKCEQLKANTIKAVQELGLGIEVEKVVDLDKIVSYGVMTIPALVIDEKVVSVGKVLTVEKVKEFIGKER